MTGLEKIINQIQEDARRDADAVIAQAKENADEILTQARADAQKLHHPHRKDDLLRRIALVIMEPSLHRYDPLAAQRAENEASGMPFDGRYGKIGNIPVIERRGYVDVIHETAEARSEDDTYLRIEIDLTPDEGRCTFDSF